MRNIPGDTGPKPPQKPPEAELKAADRLGYIADLAGELGTMARAAGRESLAIMLDQAAQEARRGTVPTVEQLRSPVLGP
jgi:hypothetical protein